MATNWCCAMPTFRPTRWRARPRWAGCLRIDGVGTTEAARAILSVLPLDEAVDDPARRMEIMGQPHEIPPVQQEMQREIDAAEGACARWARSNASPSMKPRAAPTA